MKVLYVARRRALLNNNGGSKIEYRNREIIKRLQISELKIIEIDNTQTVTYWDNITLSSSPNIIKQISKEIESGDYTHMYIPDSTFGRVIEYFKKRYPRITIVTFFHNVEYFYYCKKIKATNSYKIHNYIASISIKNKERKSCKYSDKVITLNQRDAADLKKLYGCNVDAIIPTSLDDKFDDNKVIDKSNKGIDYLFVGYNFYANIEGLQWFISNVLPHIPGVLYIVGNEMDKANFTDINHERVKIKGYVEDLSDYYYNARVVVSPILSGSGMKTKTAEAMMYGKIIVGTRESFEGYEIDDDNIYECNSADEYIKTLTKLHNSGDVTLFNQSVRDIFVKNYTQERAELLFQELFESIYTKNK